MSRLGGIISERAQKTQGYFEYPAAGRGWVILSSQSRVGSGWVETLYFD